MKDLGFLEHKSLIELGVEFRDRLTCIKINYNNNGILSGFDKLDNITKGFKPSNLILIGGRKGMGKTLFAISLIRKMVIENQFPIVFFSLKITSNQLMTTIVNQQTNISIEKIRSGTLNCDEMELVSNKIRDVEKSPLYVYDYPSLTVLDIEETLSYYPPDFAQCILIDSLQLLAKGKKDKAGKILNKRELTLITFQLKKLAKKLNITIIVTANLNITKKQYSLRPLLSDLRKCAPIDTFADLVLLLYRPEYYKIEEWDDDEETPTNGEAEIIIAKNANGILDNIRVKFNSKLGMFDNLNSYKG